MSHFSNGGKTAVCSTSPMIVKRSAMQPNTSFLGSSGGTSFATGFPFLVMTTGVRYFLTSSITRRHRALNSPAGIVFMVSSMGSWSRPYDHDSIGSYHGGCRNARGAPRQQRAESVRSEEHTSELQSRSDTVCRLLLEKKKRSRVVRSTKSRPTSPVSHTIGTPLG